MRQVNPPMYVSVGEPDYTAWQEAAEAAATAMQSQITRAEYPERLLLRNEATLAMAATLITAAAQTGYNKHAEYRDMHSLKSIINKCKRPGSAYTVGVLSSGGCLDTIAAIRAGF